MHAISKKRGEIRFAKKIALNQVITTFLQRKKRAYIPAWLQVHVFYELGQKVIDFILQTRNHQRELQKLVQILFDGLIFFALLDYRNKKILTNSE